MNTTATSLDLKNDRIFNRPKTGMIPDHFIGGIDIELSNHCNARCYFCPRDLIQETGFMTVADYNTVVDQASAFPEKLFLFACGHGESVLHPKVGQFIDYARQKNISFGLQTNGSLLTPERRRELLDNGLSTLHVSISALGALYEQMYQLRFDDVVQNVDAFIKESRGACDVGIYIVQTDLNKHLIPDYKNFWQEIGVDHCHVFPVHNRAGSIPDKNLIYTRSAECHEADAVMREYRFSGHCTLASPSYFIGYDGNHYLCCNDWEKRVPLGHVSQISLQQAARLKMEMTGSHPVSICQTCDMNITNRIKDCLRAEDGSKQLIDQLIHHRTREEAFLQDWHSRLTDPKP